MKIKDEITATNCLLSDRTCSKSHCCDGCQIKKTHDLGFETMNEPIEDGLYLCRCQFYKDENDIAEEEIEWFGEWKITDTWNLLGWKKR